MSATELLVAACFVAGLYRLLTPLKRSLERRLRKFFGAQAPDVIDVSIIRNKKETPPKE